jgi:uncharacterized protein (TIGR00725 family)
MASQSTIITVFGSSRPRPGESDYEEARRLGGELARRSFQVCSGGYAGVMEAVSRGAKEAGGRTIAITSTFFRGKANEWVDEEHAASTWQERLFELIRFGEGYVACKGGTGTLVELAVVWEMLNKGVMAGKPFITLGDFWRPIVERVREVEIDHGSRWAEAKARLVYSAKNAAEAADYLAQTLAPRR